MALGVLWDLLSLSPSSVEWGSTSHLVKAPWGSHVMPPVMCSLGIEPGLLGEHRHNSVLRSRRARETVGPLSREGRQAGMTGLTERWLCSDVSGSESSRGALGAGGTRPLGRGH